MKKTIIALCGDMRSGKSSVARSLYQKLDDCMIIPFAGISKQCIEMITGIEMNDRLPDGSYDYSQLQKQKSLPGGMMLGQFIRDFSEAVRTIDPYIWADATIRQMININRRNYIIPDLRMKHEFEALIDLEDSDDYRVFIYRIQADDSLKKLQKSDGRDLNHPTEVSHKLFNVDKTFTNKVGLINLESIANDILRDL
jgi:hypothetical protein